MFRIPYAPQLLDPHHTDKKVSEDDDDEWDTFSEMMWNSSQDYSKHRPTRVPRATLNKRLMTCSNLGITQQRSKFCYHIVTLLLNTIQGWIMMRWQSNQNIVANETFLGKGKESDPIDASVDRLSADALATVYPSNVQDASVVCRWCVGDFVGNYLS